MATATPRQILLAHILSKCNDGSTPVAYIATPALNTAIDNAGLIRTTGPDGLQQVLGGQSPDIIAFAVETALFNGQLALIKAIFQGEQQRLVALESERSTSFASQKSVADSTATNYQGVVFT